MAPVPKKPSLDITAAVDFGTDSSGHSSCVHGGRPCVQTKYPGQPQPYPKTKTCMLYRSDSTGVPVAYGWEAHNLFTSMSKAEQQQHCYVTGFKLGLDSASSNTASCTQIPVPNKQTARSSLPPELTTQKLITDFLRCLWKHLMEKLKLQWGSVNQDAIAVVLSVPAAWSDSAKQTMRQAAADAGLIPSADTGRLSLVHEPEAAALAVLRQAQTPVALSEGDTNIIVDVGGGTADITCHKVNRANGQLALSEETYRQGVTAGSSLLNPQLMGKLREVLGPAVFDEWAERNPADAVKLQHDRVELAKRSFDGSKDISIELPISLVKRLSAETIKKLQLAQDGVDDEVVIAKQAVRAIFDSCVGPIIKATQQVLTRVGGKCDHMMIVGGFAESPYLVQQLRDHFKGSVNHHVVVPDNPSQAVLTGAALYGNAPDAIVARCSRLAYGIETTEAFVSGHRQDLLYTSPSTGKRLCSKMFARMVKQDESVEHDQAKTERFSAVEKHQAQVAFNLYTCDNNADGYVDAKTMKKVSEVTLHIADPTRVVNPDDYKFTVTFMLGGSELIITAVDDQTQKQVQTTVMFVAE